MLRLDLSRQALRFVDPLPAKQYRQVLNKVLALMKDPEPNNSLDLEGYSFKRVDIGEYRIIYHVEEDTLYVDAIGKRNDSDIYRQFRNLKR